MTPIHFYYFHHQLLKHYDNLVNNFDTDDVLPDQGRVGVTPLSVIEVLQVKKHNFKLCIIYDFGFWASIGILPVLS